MSNQGYDPNRGWGAVAAEITRKPLPWWWRIDMWRMNRKLTQIDRGIEQFARIIP